MALIKTKQERVKRKYDTSKHDELCHLAAKWLKNFGCTAVVCDLMTYAGQRPDAIGWKNGDSIVIEVKVSRQDFMRDKKKWHKKQEDYGVGKYRFYLCPENLIKPEELPAKSGLLYATASGFIKKIVFPQGNIFSGHSWESFSHDIYLRGEILMLLSIIRRKESHPQQKD